MPSLWRGHVSICSGKRFLWYRVAKVATRSIYYHLKQHVHLDCDHAHDVLLPVNQYADYFKFGFVRNPWDRLVSCWARKIVERSPRRPFDLDEATRKRLEDFSVFVDWIATQDLKTCNPHFRLQCCLLDLSLVDFVGRFERLDDDYAELCDRLDIPMTGYRHRNRSDRAQVSGAGRSGHYREFYTDALAERVYRLYRKDIQVFGYRF